MWIYALATDNAQPPSSTTTAGEALCLAVLPTGCLSGHLFYVR